MIFDYVTSASKETTYEVMLPTKKPEITHWYPCMGLRDIGDECEIYDIVIE